MAETTEAPIEINACEIGTSEAAVEINAAKTDTFVAPIHRVIAVDFFAFFE